MTQPKQYQTKTEVEALPYYDQETWRIGVKRYSERTEQVTKNISACYGILWGQMTHSLRNKIKSGPGYKVVSEQCDTLELFIMLEKVCNLTSSIDDYWRHVPVLGVAKSTDARKKLFEFSPS